MQISLLQTHTELLNTKEILCLNQNVVFIMALLAIYFLSFYFSIFCRFFKPWKMHFSFNSNKHKENKHKVISMGKLTLN